MTILINLQNKMLNSSNKKNRNYKGVFLNTRVTEKIFNSLLQFHLLWKIVFPNNDLNNLKNKKTLLDKFVYKLFWFWPRNIEAAIWANDEIGGLKDPNHFLSVDSDINFIIDKITFYTPNLNSKILDLGCNVGRASNLLCKKGYVNLYGVDISSKSYDLMKKIFPDLFKIFNFERNLFQNYLTKTKNEYFETTFSIGATIENVHPSYPLIKNLCRITKKTIILDIYDSGHSYPRFWEWEFNKHNFYIKELYRTEVNKSTKFIFVKNL